MYPKCTLKTQIMYPKCTLNFFFLDLFKSYICKVKN
ncbi:MAG: hypothetical protein H6Q20_1216 [Bacteroidetes bacterium]|nr:hypothetical protein [Bacteroidota bacterium]